MPRPEQHAAGAPGDDQQKGSDTQPGPPREKRPRSASVWTHSGAGYSTTIDGRDYRVTRYPVGSALDAPYGAYAEGRFIGSGQTLESVKSRCTGHAGRLRLRFPSRSTGA